MIAISKVKLNVSLDSYFLLGQTYHISLVHHKLSLACFVASQRFVLDLHNVSIRLLFVSLRCRLVYEPYVVHLVANKNSFVERKYLKIRDNPVYGDIPYFEGGFISIGCENSQKLFVGPEQVKGILLLTILQGLNLLMVDIFGIFLFFEVLTIKRYLISSNYTNHWHWYNLKNAANYHLICVNSYLLHYFFRL